MPAIKTRIDLLTAIKVERRRLEHHLAQINPASFCDPEVCGLWSIKDLLAHLAAWEQTFLRWYEARERMVEHQEPEEVRTMKAIHAYNQQLYEQYRDWLLDDVLKFFHQSYDQIFTVVTQIPEEDLFTQDRYPWTGRWTLAAFVIANTSNHYLWAKNCIIRWKKQVTS